MENWFYWPAVWYWWSFFWLLVPRARARPQFLMPFAWLFYGRTPRLGNFSENSNEIMHRSRMECMAEVTFETSTGRYRSMWAHKRRGTRAQKAFWTGNIQAWKRWYGKLVSEVRSIFWKGCQKYYRHGFWAVHRSMLLAQGNFFRIFASWAKWPRPYSRTNNRHWNLFPDIKKSFWSCKRKRK